MCDGLSDKDFFDHEVLVGFEAQSLAESVFEVGKRRAGVFQLLFFVFAALGALRCLAFRLVDVLQRLCPLVVVRVFLPFLF